MLDFVYKGNAYSLFYSKTNDEVPVVDIKGCQLENKNSFVRTRGLVLIAENAIWDEKGIIDRFFDSYLQHITDEKPITARQCIKLLPTIAKHKPELKKWMADALHVADLSCYKESMRPLVENDIENALAQIQE